METDKAQRYLGISLKAGLLAVGEELCGEAAAAGRAKLLLLAQDASDNAARRAESFVNGRRALLRRLPWPKEELSRLTGRHGCSMLCLTDIALAHRFAAAMAETQPDWAETASTLDARSQKAQRRRAAPRKHGPTEGNRRNKNGD